jgi:hypothetical protein
MLVVVLSVVGLVALVLLLAGSGPDRAFAQLSVAHAIVIEPAMHFLISVLELLAPFDLPAWFKQLYAVLALIAIGGLVLSTIVGLVLLPIFYALYRNAER